VYDETAVTALEDRVVSGLTPSLRGRALLDAACGTAWRLEPERVHTRLAVGVDLVPEMLSRAGRDAARGPRREPGADARRGHPRPLHLAAADLRALPFGEALFDVVWCRLALGYLAELDRAYRELGRVARPTARLVVSDFHPAAVAAGHTRTFRDRAGVLRTVEDHVHTADDHARAARDAGWRLERALDVPAGEPEKPFYERVGRLDQLERERELPLVLALLFAR
jgi:SAM-dependent methyltransferase